MDAREERVVRNETLYREVNERIADVSALAAVNGQLELICECGEASCQAPIALTQGEYERVRSVATHFAVVPGHDHPDVERVIEQNERFAIVAKFGEAEGVAEQSDPRGAR